MTFTHTVYNHTLAPPPTLSLLDPFGGLPPAASAVMPRALSLGSLVVFEFVYSQRSLSRIFRLPLGLDTHRGRERTQPKRMGGRLCVCVCVQYRKEEREPS